MALENNLQLKPARHGATKLLFALFVAALCIVPGFLFSRLYVTDPFLYQVIAYVRLTLHENHLDPFVWGGYSFRFVDYLPGYPMLLSSLSRLAAIPPEQLQFMPISAILLPVSYFALSYRLVKSIPMSFALALYGAYDIGLASNYNVFAYTWSNLIYLFFILFSLRLLERRKAGDITVLFILFGASVFLHYAATLWLITYVFSLNLLLVVQQRPKTGSQGHSAPRASFAMPFAFVIAFLSFNQIFYSVWLPKLTRVDGSGSSPFHLFAAKLGNYFGQDITTVEAYLLLNPWGKDFGAWRAAQYLLIALPIIVWFLKIARDLTRRYPIRFKHSAYLPFTFTVLVTAVVDWFVYGAYQGINLRYASLMFPFLTVIALDQINTREALRNLYIGVLLIAAAGCYVLALKHYASYSPITYSRTRPGSEWLLQHRIRGALLSDLDMVGSYLVNSTTLNTDFPRSLVYDSDIFASVAEPNQAQMSATTDAYRFVLMDAGSPSRPLHGIGNRIFQPLFQYLPRIAANTNLSRIYDDGSTWIFRTDQDATE